MRKYYIEHQNKISCRLSKILTCEYDRTHEYIYDFCHGFNPRYRLSYEIILFIYEIYSNVFDAISKITQNVLRLNHLLI